MPASPEPRLARLHGHSFRVLVRADATCTDRSALDGALANAIAPLDYALINDSLAAADEPAIARYLASRFTCPVSLCLHSTPERGVLVDQGLTLLFIGAAFEAAHHLPHVPCGHKCGRLHGHQFVVRLFADANQTSYQAMQAAWQPLLAMLQHGYLNNIAGLENPTSEMIALWLFERLKQTLPALAWAEVRETRSAGSQYDGQMFHIWKEQRFESAALRPDGAGYTGHSYLIRLMLAGDLDRTLGWLLDFGDVKDRFKPVYRQMDHNPLDELAGIRNGDSATVCEWVHRHLSPLIPELARVDLHDSAERGVSLIVNQDMRWPLLQG